MPSETFTAAVKAKEEEYPDLVSEFRSLEWVSSAYQSLQQKIRSLETDLKVQSEVHANLEQDAQREHEDVTKLARSTSMRVRVLMTGGRKAFVKQTDKEKEEWMRACKKEREQHERVQSIEEQLIVLRKQENELAQENDRYQAARTRLDDIYRELFEGPTNGYPEEDAKEQELEDTAQALTKAHEQLSHWSEANFWLSKADESLQKLHQTLSKAECIIRTGEKDAVSQLGKMADLKGAIKCYIEVETFVHEARKLQPTIPHFGSITVPDLSHAPKSYLRDISFHRDLLKASDQCKVAVTKLDEGLQLSRQGMDDCDQLIFRHSNNIVSLQKDLEKMRHEIMEHVGRAPEFLAPQEANVHNALMPRLLSAAIQSGGASRLEAPVAPPFGMPMPQLTDSVEAGITASFATLSFSDPVHWITEPGIAVSSSNGTGPYPSAMTTANPVLAGMSSGPYASPSSPIIPIHSKPRWAAETHIANILYPITPVDRPPSWVSSGITEVRIVVDTSSNSARLEWAGASTPLTGDMRFLPNMGRSEWNAVGNSKLAFQFTDSGGAWNFKSAIDKALLDLVPVPPYYPEDNGLVEGEASSSSMTWPFTYT